MHDAVADDDGGGGGGQPGAVAVATTWGDGRLGAPLNLPLRHQQWEAGRKYWGCALGMSGVWRDVGCGGSFHPGALRVKGEEWGLRCRGGDGKASDGTVWRDGHADALLVGCVCAEQE